MLKCSSAYIQPTRTLSLPAYKLHGAATVTLVANKLTLLCRAPIFTTVQSTTIKIHDQ